MPGQCTDDRCEKGQSRRLRLLSFMSGSSPSSASSVGVLRDMKSTAFFLYFRFEFQCFLLDVPLTLQNTTLMLRTQSKEYELYT
jgi:hypothetical protein